MEISHANHWIVRIVVYVDVCVCRVSAYATVCKYDEFTSDPIMNNMNEMHNENKQRVTLFILACVCVRSPHIQSHSLTQSLGVQCTARVY